MFRLKVTAAVAVAAAAALALAGCSSSAGGAADTKAPATGGSVILGAFQAPKTYDPAGAGWDNVAPYFQAVFDTLLYASSEGTIEPYLATKWSYNDDNTVLTLTLRDDVKFTDGTKLDADAVKQNLERFKAGTSADASYFAGVKSFEAPDAKTVVITLAAPNPSFLSYLTRDAGIIGSPKSFSDPNLATDPIGSGAYILDTGATVTGTSYVYTKNPHYWNPDVQHYDKLTINLLADPTAATNAIKAGEANLVKLINNNSNAEIEGAGWTINTNQMDFQGLLLFDRAGTMNPALKDVRVRQAINYAMDRKSMLKALQSDNGSVTEQVFPAASKAYEKTLDERYPYDPKKAKELLAEAGYADGLTIAMPSSTVLGETTYTLIAQQLKDVGITAEYTSPGANFIADVLTPKYPAMFFQLQQTSDWQVIQSMLAPTAVWNPFHYADPTVADLTKQIQYGDDTSAAAAAKKLNEYIVEQAWFAPFYHVQGAVATDADTTVKMMPTNAYPSIYDIAPAK